MPAVKEIMAEETVRNMASLSILNARPDITPLVVAYADQTFRCTDYGFKSGSQIDLSCAKTIIIGDPKPMSCAAGL